MSVTPATMNWFHPHCRPWLGVDQPMVLGVSGGADSMALLQMVTESAILSPRHVLVGHFNHHLRHEADDDADFVQQRCNQLGLTCHTGHWQPPVTGNLYESARLARYTFLATVARQSGAKAVAVAHHQDDQGETFLDHLLRGSGLRGLTGMKAARPLQEGVTLLRPLLHWRRREIEDWLNQRQLTWRDDLSNQSISRQRGWLRHHVVPGLNQVLARDAIPGLAATGERLQQADDALEWTVDHLWPQLDVMVTGENLSLNAARVESLPGELLRRVVERCRQRLVNPSHPLCQRAVAGVIKQVGGRQKKWLMEVQGITLYKSRERIYLLPGRLRRKNTDS